MYVKRNTEALSRNRGKAICIASSEFVFVSFHAANYIVISGLLGSTIFFNVIAETARF
jgi:hypothetical protein